MSKNTFLSICLFAFISNSLFAFAQSREDIEECASIIKRMSGPMSAASKYVQVNVKLVDGSTVEDLDRGWLLSETQDFQTILNDRLLVRQFFTSPQSGGSLSFEVVSREDEPLSKADHSHALEMRRQSINRVTNANELLGEDLLRYPLFTAEMSRFAHIVVQSMTHPEEIDRLIQHAKDIDFKEAYVFRINGCECITNHGTWQENGKCCLSNCYLTQAFTKIADSKRVSVDECVDFVGKFIRMIEDESIRCSRLEEMKNAERSLFIWKKEKIAIENRLINFPTPYDIALSFLMSSGNIPLGDRSINFETSHYVDRKLIWSVKENVEVCERLSNVNLPTRYVVADRGEGLYILSVGNILRLCGPKELFGPVGIDSTDN